MGLCLVTMSFCVFRGIYCERYVVVVESVSSQSVILFNNLFSELWLA